MIPLLLLGGLALVATSGDKKAPALGPSSAGPGAGGLNTSGLLGVENVGGVLRYRPDVAAGLVAGALATRGLGPPSGPNGQRRGLVPYQTGGENAAVWIAQQVAYGYAVLISADGREPGELWACLPADVAMRASAAEGAWAVLLDPSQARPQQVPAGPSFVAPSVASPSSQASQVPPGWAGAPMVADASTGGAYRLRADYTPAFSAWLATRAAVQTASPQVVSLVPAAEAQQAPNALGWCLQQAAAGLVVLVDRGAAPSSLMAVAPAQAPSVAGPAGQWVIAASAPALGGLGGLLGTQPAPQAPTPQAGPVPVQQGPAPAGPAVPGFNPQAPLAGPLGGLLGGLLGTQPAPQVPQAPGLPAQPAPNQSATPAIDALPPELRAQVLGAVQAGDLAKLDQLAASLAATAPAASAEIKALAISAREARKMAAIATGRLVQVRGYADLPSSWAKWYVGDANRWRELLQYNGIGTIQQNGYQVPDPRRWFPGAEIELPVGWPGAKGLPPLARSAPRAPAPPPPTPPAPKPPMGPPAPPAAPAPVSPYPDPGPMAESARLARRK